MTIVLYHHPYSRASTVLWMLEEVGVPYELRFVDILKGEQKTPESFRQACRRFIYTENLLVGAAKQGEPAPARDQHAPSAAVPILKKVIAQMDSEDGWVGLGQLGQRLANFASDFDPRSYGCAKLSDLVRKSGGFEIDQSEGRRLKVRVKPEAPARAEGEAPKPRRRRRAPAKSAHKAAAT